jgi:hypothetical protein
MMVCGRREFLCLSMLEDWNREKDEKGEKAASVFSMNSLYESAMQTSVISQSRSVIKRGRIQDHPVLDR